MHTALQRRTSYTGRFAQQSHGVRTNSYAKPNAISVKAAKVTSDPKAPEPQTYKRLEYDLPRTARAQHLFGPPMPLPPAPPPIVARVTAPGPPVIQGPLLRAAAGSARGWAHIFLEVAPRNAVPPQPGKGRTYKGSTMPRKKRPRIEVNLNVGIENDQASLVHLRSVIAKALRLVKVYFLSVRRSGREVLLTSIRYLKAHDVVVVYGIRRKDDVVNWKAGEDRPKGMFRYTSRHVEHGGPASTKVKKRRLRNTRPSKIHREFLAAAKAIDALKIRNRPKSSHRADKFSTKSLTIRQQHRWQQQQYSSPSFRPPASADDTSQALALLDGDASPYLEADKGHEYGDYGMLSIKDQVDCDGDEFDEYSTETNSEGESIAAIAYSGPKKIIYERVRAFFLEKDPERIPEVPTLLEQYEGCEEELMAVLVFTYGPTEQDKNDGDEYIVSESSVGIKKNVDEVSIKVSDTDESNDESDDESESLSSNDISSDDSENENDESIYEHIVNDNNIADDESNQIEPQLELESPASSVSGAVRPSKSVLTLDQHRRELMQLSAEMNPPDDASPWTTMKRSVKSATIMDDLSVPENRTQFTSLSDLEQLADQVERRADMESPKRRRAPKKKSNK